MQSSNWTVFIEREESTLPRARRLFIFAGYRVVLFSALFSPTLEVSSVRAYVQAMAATRLQE